VKLWLVGPSGKLDVLAKRALKLPELSIRAAITHSYMTVLHAIEPKRWPEAPPLEEIRAARERLQSRLLKDARRVDEKSVEAAVDRKMRPSDIGRVRSINPSDAEAEVAVRDDDNRAGGGEDASGAADVNFSTVGVFAAPQDAGFTMGAALGALHEKCRSKEGTQNDADAGGVQGCGGVGGGQAPQNPPLNVPRSDAPVPDYGNFGEVLMRQFWYQFPLGEGLQKGARGELDGTCKVTHRHLMLHHSNVFATNVRLILLLVNVLQRHAVNRAAGLRVHNRPEAFAAYAEMVADPGFMDLLLAAVKNPKGPEALKVFTRCLPFISLTGQSIPWGSLERAALVGDLLALGRRFGLGMNFFSAAPHDTHNATTLRMCAHTVGNASFPAMCDADFVKHLQEGRMHEYFAQHPAATQHVFDIELAAKQPDVCLEQAAVRNPVATSAVFLELVDVVFDTLFGLAPSKTTGGGATRYTYPFAKWRKGVLGKLAAWMYVIETSGRKALHVHALLFGGLSPRMLACLFGRPEFEKLLRGALEVHYKSSVPWHLHMVDCARRTLGVPPVRPTFWQPERDAWAEPEDGAREETQLHALTVGLHKTGPHAKTCYEKNSGKFGCRMTRPAAHTFGEPTFPQLTLLPDEPARPVIEYHCKNGCPTSPDAAPGGEKTKFVVSSVEPLRPSDALWGEELAEEAASDVVSSSEEDDGEHMEGKDPEEDPEERAAKRRRYPGASQILPNRDLRCIQMELGRKPVEIPVELLPPGALWPLKPSAQLRLRKLLRRAMWVEQARAAAGAAAAAATAAQLAAEQRRIDVLLRQSKAVALVLGMCADVDVARALRSNGVPRELEQRLRSIRGPDALKLVQRLREPKFKCRNALLCEYNELITSLLGCNTAPLPMGCAESAKSAMFYMIKYVTKDSAAVQESLAVLIDVKKHIDQYPSTADDSGSVERTGRHFTQRSVNQLQQEISDTQGAACLLNRKAHGASVDFNHCYPWQLVEHTKSLIAESGGEGGEGNEGEGEGEGDEGAGEEDDGEEDNDDTLRPDLDEDEEEIGRHEFGQWRKSVQLSGEAENEPARQKGTARVFKCGDKSEPVGEAVLYQYRGPLLRELSYDDWSMMVEIKKYKEKTESPEIFEEALRAPPPSGAGRPPNPRLPFPPGHPLRHHWYQSLRSKFPCNKVVGKPPPREPRKLPLGKKPSKPWRKSQARFAQYLLSVYMPWEVEVTPKNALHQVYPSKVGPGFACAPASRPQLSPSAARAWLAQLRKDAADGSEGARRTIARGRLFLLHNVFHTLYVSGAKKEASQKFRARHRDLWDSKEAEKKLAEHAGDNGLDDERADRAATLEILNAQSAMERRRMNGERMESVNKAEVWAAELVASAVGDAPPIGAGRVEGASFAAVYEKEHRKPYPVGPQAEVHLRVPTAAVKKVAKAIDEYTPPPRDDAVEDEDRGGDAPPEAWMPEEFVAITDAEFEVLRREWVAGNDALLTAWEADCARSNGEAPQRPKLPLPPLNRLQREFAQRLIHPLLLMRRARARARARGETDTWRGEFAESLDEASSRELLHLLHGPAGTGKSVLLAVLNEVMAKHRLGGLVATAYTGVAAAPLRGTTLCSLTGIPPAACNRQFGDYEAPSAGAVTAFAQYAGNLDALSVLFLDEISFNGPLFLHHLSVRLQHFLGCGLPFGGIVVILAGDFFQLPPCAAPQLCDSVVAQAVHEHLPQQERAAREEKDRAQQAAKQKSGKPGCSAKAPRSGAEAERVQQDAGEEDEEAAARPSRFDTMSATSRGTALFAKFRRATLKQPMRTDANEKEFAEWLGRFRNTDEREPVPRALLKRLHPVSPQEQSNPLWRFATRGVLSNRERMHLNKAMVLQWAQFHDVPLYKWRLPVQGSVAQNLTDEEMEQLYQSEPGLWGYFCVGCPCMLTRNIHPLLGLANGTSGTYHSLTFGDNGVRYSTSSGQSGRLGGRHGMPVLGFCEVVFQGGDRPESVNVIPELDDEQRARYVAAQSLGAHDGPIVVPVQFDHKAGKEVNKVDLVSLYAAMLGLEVCVKAIMHMVELAFAVTDYKLQGKTLDKLVLSLGPRSFKPHWKLSALYVLLSRVRKLAGLRLAAQVPDWSHLLQLKHKSSMKLWMQAYDEDGWFQPELAAREQIAINARVATAQASKKGGKQAKPRVPPAKQQAPKPQAPAAASKRKAPGDTRGKARETDEMVQKKAPPAKKPKPSATTSTCTLHGLVNEGNSCYASAMLQLLYAIPSLRAGLLSLPDDVDDVSKAVRDIFTGLQAGTGAVGTRPLFEALGRTDELSEMAMHDADEFLLWLRTGWGSGAAAERLLHSAFLGAVERRLERHCGCTSVTRQEFDGPLRLQLAGVSRTLEELLVFNYEAEILSGANAVDCETCGTRGATRKVRHLDQHALPTYLCLHTRHSGSEVIALQPTLSVSALLHDQGRPANYTFVGAVHRTAHFIAIVRQASGVWHECDDVYVTEINEAYALSLAASQGYLLLFEHASVLANHSANPTPTHGAGTSSSSHITAGGRPSLGEGRKRKAAGDPLSTLPQALPWRAQVRNANLCQVLVDGDHHCAYYAVLDGRRDGTVQHTNGTAPCATAHDKAEAQSTRARVAAWLQSDEAALYRSNVGGRLVLCCGSCDARDAMDLPRDAMDLPEAWDLAVDLPIRMPGCTCADSALEPNQRGIDFLTQGITWAGQDVLKVLAVLEGCDLAVINTSIPPTDRVRVYPAMGSRASKFCSWASELEPRILRQQAGCALGFESVREYGARGSLTRFVWPVRPLRVLLYNGVNHYDATRAIESHRPNVDALLAVATCARGARCQHHDFKLGLAGQGVLPPSVHQGRGGTATVRVVKHAGGLTSVGWELHTAHPEARIGTMVAGNSGRPGGSCGKRDFACELHARHKTQEEDVVSNWLLTHNHNTASKNASTEEFASTIARRWGMSSEDATSTATRQGVDYSQARPQEYADAWTVRDVLLSAKTTTVAKRYRFEAQYPTTLCFVAGPNVGVRKTPTGSTARTFNHAIGTQDYATFREAVKYALMAGLRAMAAEGCTVALVAGVSCGMYAGPLKQRIRAEYATLIEEVLAGGLGTCFESVVYTTLS